MHSTEIIDLPGFRGQLLVRGSLPDGRKVLLLVGTLQVQPGDAQVVRTIEEELSLHVRLPSMATQRTYLKFEGEMLPTAEDTPLWELRVEEPVPAPNGWSDPKDWA